MLYLNGVSCKMEQVKYTQFRWLKHFTNICGKIFYFSLIDNLMEAMDKI